MRKKKDSDMETHHKTLKGIITKKYKKPLWERFIDSLGTFLVAIIFLFTILTLIVGIIVVIITLIENPLSLAILVGGLFLVVVWGSR